MSAFWILLGRELRARRLLLLVSPLFGLLVLVVVRLPGARSPDPELVRGVTAAVAAGLWGIALALGLGASVVAGDLRERRLAFDFRLPASAAAIGAARLLAGLICTLGGAALVLAIPALFGADLSFVAGRLLLAELALVLLFALAHATALSIAGERLWLALDLGSLVAVGLGVWIAWRPFYRYYVPPGYLRLAMLAGALLAVGLLVAIAFQLGVGRSELDRAHRAFSLALGGAAMVVALASIAFARWYLSPAPEALVAPRRTELGSGWTLITGEARHRPGAAFAQLLHRPSGRALAPIPTPKLGWFNPYAAVAADGSLVAWLEIGEGRRDFELWTLDARDPAAEARLALDGLEWSQEVWALSPDGRRTASIGRLGDDWRLYLDELASGRRLATLALPEVQRVHSVRFMSAGRAGGLCSLSGDDQILPMGRTFEVDLATGAVTFGPPRILFPDRR